MRADAAAEAVVREALSWVGTPYRHQGRKKGVGADCLGLVMGVYAALNGHVPADPGAYAPDWAEAGGAERLMDAARRHLREAPAADLGCVVLFRWRPHLPAKHAGILTGPDRFVHAYEGHAVTVSPLVPAWRKRIAGAFRFPAP